MCPALPAGLSVVGSASSTISQTTTPLDTGAGDTRHAPAPRGVAVVRSPPTGDRNVSAGSTQVAPPLRSNEAGEGLGSPAGAGGLWANNRASLAVLVDL